jgi:hypothetical protein
MKTKPQKTTLQRIRVMNFKQQQEEALNLLRDAFNRWNENDEYRVNIKCKFNLRHL